MSKIINFRPNEECEVYRTEKSVLSQCDKTERFQLHLQNVVFDLKFCELIKLRSRLSEMDLGAMLASDTPDVEIIFLPLSERVMVLNIDDIIELKSLISGAFVMLELNSILHKTLYRAV